jgi:hypothetical protein
MNKLLPFLFLLITATINGQNHTGVTIGEVIIHEASPGVAPAASKIYAFQNRFAANATVHAHVNPLAINQVERENWIHTTIENLQNIQAPQNETSIETNITDIEDFFQISYRLQGSGYIHFDNGDWIYLVSTSSHDTEQVGDLTLAIDNHGKIYLNEGHICGGIIHFIINDKIAVKAASDFIQHFISDTDDIGWKNLYTNNTTSIVSRK